MRCATPPPPFLVGLLCFKQLSGGYRHALKLCHLNAGKKAYMLNFCLRGAAMTGKETGRPSREDRLKDCCFPRNERVDGTFELAGALFS